MCKPTFSNVENFINMDGILQQIKIDHLFTNFSFKKNKIQCAYNWSFLYNKKNQSLIFVSTKG
jgi:hypothetical protein